MTVAAGKSLGYGRVGNCFLYVSAKKPPTEADWAEYMAWFKKQLPPAATGVVYERGSGPNAAQRKQISDVTVKSTFKVAVLAPSAIVRGIVTALNWFKEGYRCFSPEEMDQALAFLGLDSASAFQAKTAVNKLLRELDG